MAADQVPILGTRFDARTPAAAVALARELYEGSEPAWIALQNPHGLNLASENTEYREAVAAADAVFNDGKGMLMAARMKGYRFPADLNGNFFTPLLLEEATRLGWPVFMYGAKPGVVERAIQKIRQELPELVVAGCEHGYLSEDERAELPTRIKESGAGLLLVGLGNPHQEIWLHRNLGATGARLGMGVGAFFDFQAGEVKRAPAWLNRIGLEWVHRLVLEPRRMWRRYVIGNPVFLWRVWRERRR